MSYSNTERLYADREAEKILSYQTNQIIEMVT